MSSTLYPTSAQTLTCFIRCQQITAMLLPIYMVRLDERTKNIYIIAGEDFQDIQITINRDGNWRFEQ